MLHLFSLIALVITANVHAAPVSVVQRQGGLAKSYKELPKPILSPYYVYFSPEKAGTLSSAFDNLGLRTATVGFVSAKEGKCEFSTDLDGLDQTNNIKDFVGKGGSFTLSFGGNLDHKPDDKNPRQHIQQACKDDASLTKLIRDAMDRFQTHNIDFDIEDNGLMADDAAAKRLANALANIKKDVPDVYITYTLSTENAGMGNVQIKQIQAAKDANIVLDGVLLMTMNFGTGDIVKNSKDAIAAGAQQVSKVYGISIEDSTKMMGMVPAIGVDDKKAVLDLNGAKDLAAFAKQNQLSTMSYWNFLRDSPGGEPSAKPEIDKSSSPDQKNRGDFFKAMLDTLASSAPSSDPNPIPGLLSPDLGVGSDVAKVEDIIPTLPPPPADFEAVQKAPLPALGPASIPTTSEVDSEET